MPIVNPDLSEVASQTAIEPGTYKAKVTNVEAGVSKSSGNPMLTVSLDVMVDGKARPRTAYLVISGKGAYGFEQMLRATGFGDIADKFKDPNVQPKPDFDTDQLIGQELEVVVEQEPYNSELRDKIRSYLKA